MLFWKNKKQKEHHIAVESVLERINKKSLVFVVERGNFNGASERVLGKNGAINVLEDVVVILCNGTEVFRCNKEGIKAGELMSGNGAMIEGIEPDTQIRRTVIAYYSYKR